MVTIEIDNSFSQIKGLTPEQFKQLRKLLSYQTDPHAAYFSGGFARTRYLLDKKGYFPTGLLTKVCTWCDKNSIVPDLLWLNHKPVSKSKLFEPRLRHTPYVDQIEAVQQARFYGRGGVVMPTGTGKSLVIALVAAHLNVRTLVIVPSLGIKKQLARDLVESLGHNSNIRVENIDNPELKTLTDFDCLIIDECHHAAAKTYQNLNKTAWKGIYYRFFLTATFFRNQENEQLLFEGIAGEVIFELSIKDAIKKGYIVPVEAYYVDVPPTESDAYTWREVYSKHVVNNDNRNVIIAQMIESLKEKHIPTLCLVKEIAHGVKLSELTGEYFANGQDDIWRDAIMLFNAGKMESLIGTTGVLGEGIDTKPAEYIIIAGLGKAKSSFMQNIGRGVRKYPGKESCKIILFRDRSHKFTLRHFNAQKKILIDEYGVTPIKL